MPKVKVNDITMNYDQSHPVIAHDVEPHLGKIAAPSQITFGRYVHPLCRSDEGRHSGAELIVFEGSAHATIYKKVEEFNEKTVGFLQRHSA